MPSLTSYSFKFYGARETNVSLRSARFFSVYRGRKLLIEKKKFHNLTNTLSKRKIFLDRLAKKLETEYQAELARKREERRKAEEKAKKEKIEIPFPFTVEYFLTPRKKVKPLEAKFIRIKRFNKKFGDDLVLPISLNTISKRRKYIYQRLEEIENWLEEQRKHPSSKFAFSLKDSIFLEILPDKEKFKTKEDYVNYAKKASVWGYFEEELDFTSVKELKENPTNGRPLFVPGYEMTYLPERETYTRREYEFTSASHKALLAGTEKYVSVNYLTLKDPIVFDESTFDELIMKEAIPILHPYMMAYCEDTKADTDNYFIRLTFTDVLSNNVAEHQGASAGSFLYSRENYFKAIYGAAANLKEMISTYLARQENLHFLFTGFSIRRIHKYAK